jgi:hypothetical protein
MKKRSQSKSLDGRVDGFGFFVVMARVKSVVSAPNAICDDANAICRAHFFHF